MNIPIYRAKGVDRYGYVEGFLIKSFDVYYIVNDKASEICDSEGGTVLGYEISKEYSDAFKIDPTTLAIHFPNIIDIKGDKIFASLQEDGKGGDIVEYNGRQEIIKYSNGTIQTYMFRFEDLKELNFKAIGIQE